MSKTILKNFSQSYKYGFQTQIEKEAFPKGLNEDIILLLSKKKKEPNFCTKNRLKAYRKWKQMVIPNWANIKLPKIVFEEITYYSRPKQTAICDSLNNIDPKILETFTKLGINLVEQNKLKNIAIDAIFDSQSIQTTYKEKLAKAGVIFCSISDALQFYPNLVEEYFNSVVPIGDNFFAALNSAVFTDGTFCYVPKNIKCPLELSTYFRINDSKAGQFERTLIIAEQNSSLKYLEGCTAPQYDENQLHAAVVELIAYENAFIEYATVQNWYSGNSTGIGGIYNFVTKRGLCVGKNSQISWTQVEKGSALTWKYPSCVLLGEKASGKFYSIALTNLHQQADTGTKMIHLGKNTKSIIISKGISLGNSTNSYRGLVKISSKADFSRNFSQCDSFIIGNLSWSCTYPYLESWNCKSVIEHEAKISKLSDEQLFYFLQRGLSENQALNLLINGFCKEVISMLPFEFASEANQLLFIKFERSLG